MLRPKEVVCKWVDAFNDHDVEAIVSLDVYKRQLLRPPLICRLSAAP